MKRIVHKHPLAIRWFHWINFPVLFVMIWSGLLIYWAYDPYKITMGSWTLSFFPDWFYKALGVPFQLAKGMAWHFVFMWLFLLNGILRLFRANGGIWCRTETPSAKPFRLRPTIWDCAKVSRRLSNTTERRRLLISR